PEVFSTPFAQRIVGLARASPASFVRMTRIDCAGTTIKSASAEVAASRFVVAPIGAGKATDGRWTGFSRAELILGAMAGFRANRVTRLAVLAATRARAVPHAPAPNTPIER